MRCVITSYSIHYTKLYDGNSAVDDGLRDASVLGDNRFPAGDGGPEGEEQDAKGGGLDPSGCSAGTAADKHGEEHDSYNFV